MLFQSRQFPFARRSYRGDEVGLFGLDRLFDALVIQNESGEVKFGCSYRREEVEVPDWARRVAPGEDTGESTSLRRRLP